MAKLYFCANCAKRIDVYRKALPTYNAIVELVVPHTCTKNPVKFDLTPVDLPKFGPSENDNKFVKKLNNLRPPKPPSIEDNNIDLRDRRPPDQVKSTAPASVINNLRGMQNTTPERDFSDLD